MNNAFHIFVIFMVTALVVAALLLNARPAIAPSNGEALTETFQGDGFTVKYPARYTASEIGLWSADRYEVSLGPEIPQDAVEYPYEGYIRITPDILFFSEVENADCFITGACLENHQQSENVTLGDHDFVLITGCDDICIKTYFSKQTDPTIGIWTLDRYDDPVFEKIIASLIIED